MNTDNNLGGVDWSQFTFPGLQDPEVSLSELETGTAEELFRSTVGSSGTPLPTQHNGAGNPVLAPPDFTLFPPSRNQLFSPDNLTKDALIRELKGIPQYQTFLQSQSVVTQDDVINHIREIISQNINTPYSLEALVGKGLADEMNLFLQAHPNPALEATWMDLRATLLVQNHPIANALIEAEKSELIQQGVDPLKAAALANAAIVTQLDQALSENGVVTPYYGLHPKMEAILDKAILMKLQGNPMAERFLGDLKGTVAGREAFLNMLGKMEGATPTPGTTMKDPLTATLHTIAYAEQQQDVVNRAIELLNKVALPPGQRESLLAFMTKISEALSIMKKLAAELNVDDLKAKLSKSQTDIQSAVAKLRFHEGLINDALKKLEDALELLETMAIVKTVLMVVSIIMMVLIIIVVTLIFVIIAVVFIVIMVALLVLFLSVVIIVVDIILCLIVFFIEVVVVIVGTLIIAIVVTSFATSQTGAMDTMMKGLFDFWMLLLNEVCHANASKETGSYIMIGILGALVAIIILAILLVIIIALILIVIVLIIAVVAIVVVAAIAIFIIVSMWCIAMFFTMTVATIITVVIAVVAVVVVVVIVVIAVILLVILTVVLFFVCLLVSQFLPELLIRSGLLDKIIASMGTTFGMDQDQMNNAQVALRIVFAMGTMMTGQSCSSSFWSLNEKDQKLVDSGNTLHADLNSDEANIKRFAYFGEIYDPSFSRAGAAMGLTSDQIALNAARVAKMVKILQEIIKKLEKLLAAILSGNGTEGADQAASLVGKNSDTIESIVDSIQDLIDDQLLTYIGPQAVQEQPNFRMPMQMMIEIMALAAASTIPPESYRSGFNKGSTMNNRTEQDLQESLLTTQGISD